MPEAGNPANPKGLWKWLPQKERALQNRQLLGFCGVPSISAVPQAGNPAIRRGLGNGLQNRQLFGFCGEVPSISAVPEAGHPADPKGPWYKIDNLWAFVGFPPFQRSKKPEIQQIPRGLGNCFRKRSGLYKIDNFWAFVVFPPFQRSHTSRKSSNPRGWFTKSTTFGLLWGSLHFGGPRSRTLEMASVKAAGCTKSTTFGLFWCSLHFGLIWVDHGVESTRAGRFCRNKPVRQQNWLRSIEGAQKQSS